MNAPDDRVDPFVEREDDEHEVIGRNYGATSLREV